MADRVGVDGTARGGFAVSGAGPMAYRGGGGASRQLTWFDRTGKAVGVAGEPDALQAFPELSPDDRRLAKVRAVQGNNDIWLQDLVRGGLSRLTFDAAQDTDAVWSPDGMRIAFASRRASAHDLYQKPSNGSGLEERLMTSSITKVPQAWSADGHWLLYYEISPTTGRDLWALDMTSPDHRPRVIANTPAQEVLAQFSPDGRWVAYQADESGRFEVVVQPFPDAGGKWQVSTAGGAAPRWRADGKELYFLAPDATMMAVPVTAAGSSFAAGTPLALFPTRIVDGGTAATSGQPGLLDNVAARSYIRAMKTVGVRELKNRLSEYLREVRAGESVLVTDRGEVVAELSAPGAAASDSTVPAGLAALARRGLATLGAPNDPGLYPAQRAVPGLRPVSELLDQVRGTR